MTPHFHNITFTVKSVITVADFVNDTEQNARVQEIIIAQALVALPSSFIALAKIWYKTAANMVFLKEHPM